MNCPNCEHEMHGDTCPNCGLTPGRAFPFAELMLFIFIGLPGLAMGGCGVYVLFDTIGMQRSDYSGLSYMIGGCTALVGLGTFAAAILLLVRARRKR